jgi:predicted Zn-dependent protease
MKRLSIVILFFFVSSCAINPVTGERELMLMSEQDEMAFGERVYPAVLWGEVGGGGQYLDPQLTSYLEGIVRDLHGVSHRPGLPVDFVVQNSSVPNAWAIPGHVSMTRGLLAHLENEAQFAFVMGHEMGHVAARHSARQYTRGVLQAVVLGGGSIFLGEEQGWLLQAAAIGSTLFFLRYSRSDELQADRLGVEYMARAGYRPAEAVEAHKQLEKAVEEYRARMGQGTPEDNFLTRLLSTHPRTGIRLEEVRETAKKAEPHYDRALALYRERKLGRAEEELRAALGKDDNQAPFFNLRGLILLKRKDYGASRRVLDKALEIYPGYHPAWQSIGLLEYERKNYGAAISPLKKSLEIFPQSIGSHYFLGMSYFHLKRYSEAVPHLEAFEGAVPEDPEVHGRLGIAYEGMAEPGKAYYEYRLQVRVAPDTELGRYAAERMAVLEQRLNIR